ncbi:MAG: Holliday junction resolvase RuvX [Chloroflexi bacterium]|nr:Holliday junction resolvase RuvX [Chloroflexota bacterium]
MRAAAVGAGPRATGHDDRARDPLVERTRARGGSRRACWPGGRLVHPHVPRHRHGHGGARDGGPRPRRIADPGAGWGGSHARPGLGHGGDRARRARGRRRHLPGPRLGSAGGRHRPRSRPPGDHRTLGRRGPGTSERLRRCRLRRVAGLGDGHPHARLPAGDPRRRRDPHGTRDITRPRSRPDGDSAKDVLAGPDAHLRARNGAGRQPQAFGDVSLIVGVDVGERRIGVATASDGGRALPVGTIARGETVADDASAIRRLLSGDPDAVVVGLPLEASGIEGRQAALTRAWAAEFERAVGLPVSFRDERLTSHLAEQRIGPLKRGRSGGPPSGTQRRLHRERVDRESAAIILQDELDARSAAEGSAAWAAT